jgi:TRAP-type mannitol/chloroaromatic compound transport system permease small subunit
MHFIRWIHLLSSWSGRLGALLVLPLVLAMVYEVISRYAFNRPTAWAFEVSYMMMGTIFLLGLSYALLQRQHVNVDFIHQRLSRRVIGAIDAAGYIGLTAMLSWMVIVLARNAMAAYASGEGSGLSAWNPQVWPYRVVYVAGFGLFALQTLAHAVESLARAFGLSTEDVPK